MPTEDLGDRDGRVVGVNDGRAVALGRVPPVVPDARLDDGGLTLMKGGDLSGALDGQLTLEHGKLLHQRGVIVLASHAHADQRAQLGGRAALGVVPGTLQDDDALPG
jgi:hypothetical protein